MTVAAAYAAPLASQLGLALQREAQSVKKTAGDLSKASETGEVIPDETLFVRAIGGDRESLGVLICRYEENLFGLLLRMTGDRHLADDLFQETFLHAMRAATSFNRKMPFKPWISAIAVNLVRDDARKRKVRSEVELSSNHADEEFHLSEMIADGEKPDECAARRDEEEYVRQGLKKLTLLEREVVLLHFYNGLTLEETAQVLKAPVGTIKSRLHGALTRLWGVLKLSQL